jgi:hypothetical protein
VEQVQLALKQDHPVIRGKKIRVQPAKTQKQLAKQKADSQVDRSAQQLATKKRKAGGDEEPSGPKEKWQGDTAIKGYVPRALDKKSKQKKPSKKKPKITFDDTRRRQDTDESKEKPKESKPDQKQPKKDESSKKQHPKKSEPETKPTPKEVKPTVAKVSETIKSNIAATAKQQKPLSLYPLLTLYLKTYNRTDRRQIRHISSLVMMRRIRSLVVLLRNKSHKAIDYHTCC